MADSLPTPSPGRFPEDPALLQDSALLHLWIAYAQERLHSLNPTQRETLQLLLEGDDPQASAAHMGISLGAVVQRKHRLFQALGVESERDAISLAILAGMQRGFAGLLLTPPPGTHHS